jgi:hypothetical protein
MTFKHTKFEDSATMRSLIKVAAEKGWVKPEPLQKTASVQEDLTPTANLTENVMKLCAGLRQSGMDKFARELEDKFVAYKKVATSLYDVSGEKGEDLIHAAHPKGGHKMNDLAGDVLVETILENRLKMLEMINKKPTGKLASHSSILHAVKIVLAEDTVESLEAKVKSNINAAFAKFNKVREYANKDLTFSLGTGAFDDDLFKNPTIDEINSTIKSVSRKIWGLKPGWSGGVTEDTWSIIQPMIPQINGYLSAAMEAKKKANAIRAGVLEKEDPLAGAGSGAGDKKDDKPLPPPPPHWKNLPDGRSIMSPLYNNFKKIKSLKGILSNLKAIGGIANNKDATGWIDEEIGVLDGIDKRYTAVEWNDNAADLNGAMQGEIAAEEKDINAFKSQWAPAPAPVS